MIPFGKASGGVCQHYTCMIRARPRKAELKKILDAEDLSFTEYQLDDAMDLTSEFDEERPEFDSNQPNPYDDDDEYLFDEDFDNEPPPLDNAKDSDKEDDEVRYKDPRFPTDTELSRTMLKEVILRDAIAHKEELKVMRARVKESEGLNVTTALQNIDDIDESILLALDGTFILFCIIMKNN